MCLESDFARIPALHNFLVSLCVFHFYTSHWAVGCGFNLCRRLMFFSDTEVGETFGICLCACSAFQVSLPNAHL